MLIVIRTKTPAQYFRGEVKKMYHAFYGKDKWIVTCLSFAGGGRHRDPLKVTDWKMDKKGDLMTRIKNLCSREKYLLFRGKAAINQ